MTYGWGISDEERTAALEMADLVTPKFNLKWPTLDYSTVEKRVVDRLFSHDIYQTVADQTRQMGKKWKLAHSPTGRYHDSLMNDRIRFAKLAASDFPRWSECAGSIQQIKDPLDETKA